MRTRLFWNENVFLDDHLPEDPQNASNQLESCRIYLNFQIAHIFSSPSGGK